LYFAQSQCFVKSEGKLSCFTCHAPHAAVSRGAPEYSRRCQSCHQDVRHKTAIAGSCTSCHMPIVKPGAGLQFANHWIGVYSKGRTLRPVR
jgi:hypothetical protein